MIGFIFGLEVSISILLPDQLKFKLLVPRAPGYKVAVAVRYKAAVAVRHKVAVAVRYKAAVVVRHKVAAAVRYKDEVAVQYPVIQNGSPCLRG